ncbi:MAG: hypothetical protein B5M54_05605 [Candidatus Aminicenantes bacterium 4484_214]|nr:MAG: hypothetical protein B5M54_05605 [Candidatus Aminicenantes bacterium 4484_214]
MKRITYGAIILILVFSIGVKGKMINDKVEQKNFMRHLVPSSFENWQATEEKFYDPQTIFDYIDGAGEVYRAYNFQLLLSRAFHGPSNLKIFVDLFDMGSGANAFGVFTHDREGEKLAIGQGAVYKGGLLSFWKGRFFVSIFAEVENQLTKNAILNLGQMIAAQIKETSPLPELIHRLPPSSLIEDKIHYFSHHLILNYHYFVADENILELNNQTEAVLAFYQFNKEKTVLLGIRYPHEKKALLAQQRFRAQYLPEVSDQREKEIAIQTENNLWTATSQKKNLLVIVFDAPSKEKAFVLINKFFHPKEKRRG